MKKSRFTEEQIVRRVAGVTGATVKRSLTVLAICRVWHLIMVLQGNGFAKAFD